MAKKIDESPREMAIIIFWWLYISLYTKCIWFFVDLTAYFPFSVIFYNSKYHNDFKNRLIALNILTGWANRIKVPVHVLQITEDSYYVYTQFLIESDKKEKRNLYLSLLKRKIGEDNYYLSKKNNYMYQINFIKDNISKKMLRFA